MILVAIDSSSTCTGISCWEDGELKDYVLINLKKVKDSEIRLKEMCVEILKKLEHYSPTSVVIEDTSVVRNPKTFRMLTTVVGVVYGYSIKNKCDFKRIKPTEWRKTLGFKQGSKVKREELKEQSIRFVLDKFNLEVNDDIADSICIGYSCFCE